MDQIALFLLGRKLMQIAQGALPKGKGAISARLIFVDVVYHPGSSISEITERTGYPQSLVSTAVARLRGMGFLQSSPDPLDRRRTLVQANPAFMGTRGRVVAVPIDDIVAKELGAENRAELAHVMAALALLSRVLTPEVAAEVAGDHSPPTARASATATRSTGGSE